MSPLDPQHAAKATSGCQIKTFLLNDFFPKLKHQNGLHFLEVYELSGIICQDPMYMDGYLLNNKYDGLIVCFDLNNLKSFKNMRTLLRTIFKFDTSAK